MTRSTVLSIFWFVEREYSNITLSVAEKNGANVQTAAYSKSQGYILSHERIQRYWFKFNAVGPNDLRQQNNFLVNQLTAGNVSNACKVLSLFSIKCHCLK